MPFDDKKAKESYNGEHKGIVGGDSGSTFDIQL